ncbi:hypothetical protein BS50DRAFT_393757 [Corynespora cassiicola Philippines]|uniref:Uncharacterized protein n=1 Tax=Corynespora cassiicola Philippines TaxID=1448308 RepID=A0A2T2NR12_CORCC|nr:hypothetical protein BS50DRAFT_393757 [Corynespora cassiicola Philippines]
MADPMSALLPEKLNASASAIHNDDDIDMTWHDPPSSPFVEQLDQENVAPGPIDYTPVKPASVFDDENVPQSAFKVSPEKTAIKVSPEKRSEKRFASPLKERAGSNKRLSQGFDISPPRMNDLRDNEGLTVAIKEFESAADRTSPTKASPSKQTPNEVADPVVPSSTRKNRSPSKPTRKPSLESPFRLEISDDAVSSVAPTPSKRPSAPSPQKDTQLRENEGLTVAMKLMEDTPTESRESVPAHQTMDLDDTALDFTDFHPEGPEATSLDVDDTGFSNFSEMPQLDMTKFAVLRKSPTKTGGFEFDQATPRAKVPATPSTVRRSARTPSPTPRQSRKENDTTNLLLDFTAQIEAFSSSRRTSPRGRTSPTKSTTEPNLLAYYQNQRSPGKGAPQVPSTPSQNRQLLNLLDFELPPPPTPRSVPTVTIRELESMKSGFQSQISSLTASLSGKEAEVDSLAKAVADAERRVGESQEFLRDERSAREYAEAQMEDWKKKGEEVQKLLQDVQAEMARNDSERDQLLARLAEAEKRAEESEARSSDLETKLIEAESKNTDMTTFINPDEEETRKIYSEAECQSAIAEKVNEVARDLHSAYKAKHEKKIKALKENYQKKADERCKELRLQITRLERQVEEAEKKRDDTFSKFVPENMDGQCAKCKEGGEAVMPTSDPEDLKRLEEQQNEIQSLKAKIAGLQSELSSLRQSNATLQQDLEAERVEKGELVAAAEQMLSLCGEKMEEMQQQEDLRKSQMATAPPPSKPVPAKQSAPPPADHAMRSTGFLAGGPAPSRPGSALGGARPGSAMAERNAGPAKPSGLRAPGGFGFSGGNGGASGLGRSTSGSKSRLMSNIERMGGSRGHGAQE